MDPYLHGNQFEITRRIFAESRVPSGVSKNQADGHLHGSHSFSGGENFLC